MLVLKIVCTHELSSEDATANLCQERINGCAVTVLKRHSRGLEKIPTRKKDCDFPDLELSISLQF